MTAQIKLVVGLGNPGKKYEKTRHNIGRRIVESLWSSALPVDWLVTDCYMNESGVEVSQKARYKRISPEEILIVLDEFQIPLRQIRLTKAGSDGGHNGLKSILESLGTNQVPRVRIGIGPLPAGKDPADFVLERFSVGEEHTIEKIQNELENAVAISVEQGLEAAMNKYNNRTL